MKKEHCRIKENKMASLGAFELLNVQCLLSTDSVKKRNKKAHRNGSHPDVSILLLLPEGWGSDISSSELDRFSWLPPPFACSVMQFPSNELLKRFVFYDAMQKEGIRGMITEV
jgi:hypothetical protein